MLDDLAPPGTLTEAFTWTSTGISVGIAAGSALAGVLVEAGSPAVAMAVLGAGGVPRRRRPRRFRGAAARGRTGPGVGPAQSIETRPPPAAGGYAPGRPTCAGGGIGRRARLRAL